MRKAVLYTVSIVTCLYFLSAGNMALFSKFKKNFTTEVIDFDKDTDKSDESEKSDNKEDLNGEENFLMENNLLLFTNLLISTDFSFLEDNFKLPQHSLEINSPPPQA